jgi:eukaryotic-like serine/threonine-protein kinase
MGSLLPQPIEFGKYTLFERIGRGGMADVFKGRIQGPAGFERVFVVKRILPHLSDDPTFNKMFVEEAKMSARLNHPNIVQVFELGSVEGEYFISMEYVRGRDLAETMRVLWARLGPPRPELVAYIGREMCRALAYAHNLTDDSGRALGMIHRDVSPSNVMLSYEGSVKLLDFGIAKALGDAKEENTRTGTLKGKFAYMAPEQTEGTEVDRRIDIFAAGIVLHEVLTGRRLFKGTNDLQTIERVRECQVDPPSAQNPLCPPELDAIVLRALSRDREQRYGSGAEMADALDDVVHAARFQPDHLAQLMRELFPGDIPAGADSRPSTGSVNVNALTASASRSPGLRPPSGSASASPSIPPISVSRSVTSPSGARPPALDLASLALPQAKPLWRRPPILAGAGALVLVVLALVVFTRPAEKPAQSGAAAAAAAPTGPRRPADGKIRVSVESRPTGAQVFLEGGDKPMLEATPGSFALDWNDQQDTRIIVRKAGYKDYETAVRPSADQPIFAGLKPLPLVGPAAAPIEPSTASADTSTGPRAPGMHKKGGKRQNLKKGGLISPF